ncbi:MAG: hypothetical protein CMI18_01110 [Opitutaceae bacterium]|nr:hypothetical protein [Opitutaceae bacterium]
MVQYARRVFCSRGTVAHPVLFAMDEMALKLLYTVCLERNTLCTKALVMAGFERFGRQGSRIGDNGEDTELKFVVSTISLE